MKTINDVYEILERILKLLETAYPEAAEAAKADFDGLFGEETGGVQRWTKNGWTDV